MNPWALLIAEPPELRQEDLFGAGRWRGTRAAFSRARWRVGPAAAPRRGEEKKKEEFVALAVSRHAGAW